MASKHRLQVGRRAADDAQDLAGRRLLLQRLGQLAVALLQLLEQPRVLDGDDGLVGEGLQQRDLLVGERLDLGRADTTIAPMRLAVAQQRHGEHASG